MTEPYEDAFQAFFQSSVETVGSFLRSFVELSGVERALLALGEAHDGRAEDVASGPPAAEFFSANVRAFGGEGSPAASCPRGAGLEEVIVEEASAVRTSAMTAFLNDGLVDVMPSFDNFVQDVDGGDSFGNGGGGWKTAGESTSEGAPHDDATRVACDGGTGPDNSIVSVRVGPGESTGEGTEDSDDSEGGIELPGLSESPVVSRERASLTGERSAVFLSLTDLDVLRENDDEVRPFVVDPYFDYDAVCVGTAAKNRPLAVRAVDKPGRKD